MGNLNNDLIIQDLKELFVSETIKHLEENCSITMPKNRKTGKIKMYCIRIISIPCS